MRVANNRWGIRLVQQNAGAQGVGAIVRLFERIAAEEGWQPGTALSEHVDSSTYLALVDVNETIGGIQMVLPSGSPEWWPSREVWPECDPGATPDVAHVLMMALHKDYRGRSDLFLRLCTGLLQLSLGQGITELRLECTPATCRVYRRFGMPLDVIGPSRIHWGEPCLPARMSIPGVSALSREKADRLPSYRALLGDSLDGTAA